MISNTSFADVSSFFTLWNRSQGDTAYQKYVNQAITELQALHNYPAENVLPLMAFSFTETMESDPCLVYLYMPNGSVADRLKCRGGKGNISNHYPYYNVVAMQLPFQELNR